MKQWLKDKFSSVGVYFVCLVLLILKGLGIGLGWPEAIVSCVLIGASLYEKFLQTSKEIKEIECKKVDELLIEKVRSLENKMALTGMIKHK